MGHSVLARGVGSGNTEKNKFRSLALKNFEISSKVESALTIFQGRKKIMVINSLFIGALTVHYTYTAEDNFLYCRSQQIANMGVILFNYLFKS